VHCLDLSFNSILFYGLKLCLLTLIIYNSSVALFEVENSYNSLSFKGILKWQIQNRLVQDVVLS